jgi:hypothetical protein
LRFVSVKERKRVTCVCDDETKQERECTKEARGRGIRETKGGREKVNHDEDRLSTASDKNDDDDDRGYARARIDEKG